MDRGANRSAVSSEILKLENDLIERLQHRTQQAGIGFTNVAMKTEQELCQSLLVDGKPKAFLELFNITATLKIDPTPKEDEEAGILNPIAEAQKTLKHKETLSVLCEHLVAAEVAARNGDEEKSFIAHSGIGNIFDNTCYFEKSIEYYTKSLDAAVSTKNNVLISQAKYYLGKVYWKMHEGTKAVESYEECLALAKENKDEEQIVLASTDLLEIYWHCAEDSRSSGNPSLSIEYFRKVVSMAELCSDVSKRAEAVYNIGQLWAKLENLESSMKHQTEYLEHAVRTGNKAGECKARASIAEAYEVCGDVQSAIEQLNAYLETARAFDLATEARGHCLLGMLYHRQNQKQLSLQHLDKYFAMSRTLENPDFMDVGRVNIGIVRDGHGQK